MCADMPCPGDMWQWIFKVNNGTWPCTPVTSNRGPNSLFDFVTIIRDDVFVFVAVFTKNPNQVLSSVPMTVAQNPCGEIPLTLDGPMLWHVVLLNGRLIWFEHTWLSQAKRVDITLSSEDDY